MEMFQKIFSLRRNVIVSTRRFKDSDIGVRLFYRNVCRLNGTEEENWMMCYTEVWLMDLRRFKCFANQVVIQDLDGLESY